MKLSLVVYSNDPETVWNAFRFGNHAAKHHGDEVRGFLLGRAAEAESLGGTILACGTCLKLRQAGSSAMCSVSTMDDLHRLVAGCDQVLTF